MQNESLPTKLLYTPKEAAHMLSMCLRTLYSLTKAGVIHAVREGRAVKYADPDLRLYVDRLRHPEL